MKKAQKKKRVAKPKRLCLTEVQKKLARLLKGKGTKVIRVNFTNDDVPKFLENLRRFEEESCKVVIFVNA